MYRKMNAAHRHTGRMTSDPRMRMSNKAEVGMGCIGLLALVGFIAVPVLLILMVI
jgi:hypothetical protein